MIANGGDAVNITQEVEDILKNETMNGGSVTGGTISSLVNVLEDLIVLRRNQTNEANFEQTIDFTESFLQSVDIIVLACEGWKNIFNSSLRYDTVTNYLRCLNFISTFYKSFF